MIRGRLSACAVLALMAAISASRAEAQQAPGASLVGLVTDQSGGSVPQTTITARRLATGVERRVDTNSEGAFAIADLRPGDYEVTASAERFAVAVQRISVRGGESRLNFQLRVGDLTEDVVVVAGELAGSHERLRRLPGSVDV